MEMRVVHNSRLRLCFFKTRFTRVTKELNFFPEFRQIKDDEVQRDDRDGVGVVLFLFAMVNTCIRFFLLLFFCCFVFVFFWSHSGKYDPTSELLQEKSHGDNHEDRDEDDKND